MDGFLDVIIEGVGVTEVVAPVAALLVFTAVFTGIAATQFRFEESKVYVA